MKEWPSFWDRVKEERAEVISYLKSAVSTFTENFIEAGGTEVTSVIVGNFLENSPEYNHEELIPIIEKECGRIVSIILRDREELAKSS